MIKIQNLTKQFGNFKAVDGLSLDIKPGEIFGFLGPNGAGKTTTVKVLSGIMRPTSGNVFISGLNMENDAESAKKVMAYIPDEPFVYPKLTAWEFMRFVGDVYDVSLEEQKKRIPELFESFELSSSADELLEGYSHGMKQKLLIASVLLRKPKVVLFDEPTVGLDPKSIRKFKTLLRSMAQDGTAVFMCTHILDMAEKLCDTLGIIFKGKLIAHGSVKDIKTMPGVNNSSLEDAFLTLTASDK